jgi:lysozyme
MKIVNYIKHWEGFRSKFYKCPAGKKTIGYGRNVDDFPLTSDEYRLLFPGLTISESVREISTKGITELQAEKLLSAQAQNLVMVALRNFLWFGKLSEGRQIVILDMIYNLGLPGFRKFKRLIEEIGSGNYEKAGREIENSRYYTQTGNRAKSNVDIMCTDILPGWLGF